MISTRTQIDYLKPSQIRLDPQNVYTHSDADIQRLVGSINEHGFLEPLVVDSSSLKVIDGEPSYELVGGEARLEAAKACALQEVPCTIAVFRDNAQRTAAAVALNGRYGKFDDDKLTGVLRDLSLVGYDLDYTGLEPYRLDDLLGDVSVQVAEYSPFTGGYAETEEETAARAAKLPTGISTDEALREINIRLGPAEYADFMAKLDKLRKIYGTATVLATIQEAVNRQVND